jgi:uncharacterized protein (DUF302 family)
MDQMSAQPSHPASGGRELIISRCAVDVPTAVERCTSELARRGLTLFGVFDHGSGARSAGLDLAPEVVVAFGDPAVGTRLMQVDPTIGIELPLKLLLWEHGGAAQVAFVDPLSWPGRYAVPADHPVLAGMHNLLSQLAGSIAGPA